jgi:dynein heavy chain
MATILDTMPKGAGGGTGLTREEIVDHICQDLLSKVGRLSQATVSG